MKDEQIKGNGHFKECIKEMEAPDLDVLLTDIEAEMDRGFMHSGKTLAELFRAVCSAAIKLPNLEIHTELMCVINEDDSMTVIFHRRAAECGPGNSRNGVAGKDETDDSDEDEEGLVYDGD